jgi:glycosyltransferase involved in cell wall biosynthesis
MRLLYLVHQFPPQFTTGTEILTLETARAAQALGHEVEILTAHLVDTPPGQDAPEITDVYDGIRVHRYPYYQANPLPTCSPHRAEYNNPLTQDYLRRLLASFRPDIVHAFHLYRLSAAAFDTIKEFGIPLIFSVTDFWPVCPAIDLRLPDGAICAGPRRNSSNCLRHLRGEAPWKRATYLPTSLIELWARRIEAKRSPDLPFSDQDHAAALILRQSYLRQQLPKAKVLITPSQIVRKHLTAFGIHEDAMRHLPFGINLGYIRNAPPKVPSARLRIGYIGTISRPKGLHVLAGALRELPPDLPVELKIYGRSTDDPTYDKEIRLMLEDDVRATFLGAFPNPKIGEVLAGIDVLVVPSIWLENTPLVISTAQAARVPVIASDLEGMSELIQHGVNGLLFPVGDHRALARCLKQLAAAPPALAKLAAAARPPKSIQEYAGELNAIYRTVAEGGRA